MELTAPRPQPASAPDSLTAPHGGTLIDLLATPARRAELQEASRDWPSWALTPRQLCDLELLLCGAFSPLTGFLGRADFESVAKEMRLADGTLWPIPIPLDLPPAVAATLSPGSWLALRDPEGVLLAALEISELYEPDWQEGAAAVFGTVSPAHPGAASWLAGPRVCVAGRLEGLELPAHYDFRSLRQTPAELRAEFAREGWRRVVAFQTRNPLHRAHCEMIFRAAQQAGANLLIHPVVGMTKPGDLDHYTRVRCYRAVLGRFPQQTVKLSLLPLAMRMAGPREAMLHAIVRKNYGCTHFIVGRDHAGPGNDTDGKPFYGPYDAQELLAAHQDELGIAMVPFRAVSYVPERDEFLPEDEVPAGMKTLDLSGTELRRRLQEGREIPAWFTFPEVADELRRAHPPRSRQGFTVFFTGLSGAGKSTLAAILRVKLLEMGGRPVTLLDGDMVRKQLSSELSFSKEHRDLNIRRIGYVASEITKNGGIALCAPIAPYDATRREVRKEIEPGGGFVLVHLSTSLEACEARDRKGLYAKARAGLIPEFTGISDPYEPPQDAEIVLDTAAMSPEAGVQEILLYLEREGYVGGDFAV
jgi:sulfate adenylyltransferase